MSKRKDGTHTGSPMVMTRWPDDEHKALETAAAQSKHKTVQRYIRNLVLSKLKRDGFLQKAN